MDRATTTWRPSRMWYNASAAAATAQPSAAPIEGEESVIHQGNRIQQVTVTRVQNTHIAPTPNGKTFVLDS